MCNSVALSRFWRRQLARPATLAAILKNSPESRLDNFLVKLSHDKYDFCHFFRVEIQLQATNLHFDTENSGKITFSSLKIGAQILCHFVLTEKKSRLAVIHRSRSTLLIKTFSILTLFPSGFDKFSYLNRCGRCQNVFSTGGVAQSM